MNIFHPLVSEWFAKQYGSPTDIQASAWPEIARGEHVLVTAPTGSGKTLTAFLWALNRLISDQALSGTTRVLYVSPLKALNNDIQRNLVTPLKKLRELFLEKGTEFPSIRVLTRSGDTPQSERRRMMRQPPEILITTPESLNLMLSSLGGRSILGQVDTVILDEIHALISEKRGTYLMSAVDRLVPLAGEFQRIALSATLKPLDVGAAFIGGYRIEKGASDLSYVPRNIVKIRSNTAKIYQVGIQLPTTAMAGDRRTRSGREIWEPIVNAIKSRIARNRSTLIFVNSRKLCEKITFLINRDSPHPIAYAHHGSLARELRYTVEEKLKNGDLKAIVATNSLELGIDIGALDEVILVQSPPSIASALQRLGRAGHHVNAPSRGVLYPTHAVDILEAAVVAQGIEDQDIENARPVTCPLDVLAQVIISMAGTETWDIDTLYATLKTSHPFHLLSREHFDLVLNMLAGRYADTRIRELKARLSIDRIDNTVAARKGALLSVYMSGGVIPDRGYFSLRHAENNARIGELDEEFVWEARIGQMFTLGNQNWKIERITHNDVLVRPAGARKTAPPFWIAEARNRGFHLSERIALLLTRLNEHRGKKDLMRTLTGTGQMDSFAAEKLAGFLERQKEKTRCELPHRYHLVVEKVSKGPGGAPGNQIVLHTFWGGKVNRPYAMSLEAAWEEAFSRPLETYTDNNSICILLPHEIPPEDLLAMVSQHRAGNLIRRRLEGSGFFGARFRECAGRALLITHGRVKERLPLWINRLKSKKLFDAVAGYADFPILLEAWRSCLQDYFDLDSLDKILAELESGRIQCSFVSTPYPSPMAMNGAWRQVNDYMYRDDSRDAGNRSMLREDLIDDLLASPGFQPELPPALIRNFERKRKRENPGYAPDTWRALVDWVKERVLIPLDEWNTLLAAIKKENRLVVDDMPDAVSGRLVAIKNRTTGWQAVAALENSAIIQASLYPNRDDVMVEPLASPAETPVQGPPVSHMQAASEPGEKTSVRMRLLSEWLSFYGPLAFRTVREKTGMASGLLQAIVEDLIAAGNLLRGRFIAGCTADELCDKDNFSILLRMRRTSAVPLFKPREISELTTFVATVQGMISPGDKKELLYTCLEKLACFCAPAGIWESDILPARLSRYDTSWLDTAMQESGLLWGGCGRHKIYFGFEEDLDLLHAPIRLGRKDPAEQQEEETDPFLRRFFKDARMRWDLNTLAREAGLPLPQTIEKLWQAVWKGLLTNDTCVVLRSAIASRFHPPQGLSGIGSVDRGRQPRAGKRAGHHVRRRARRQKAYPAQAGNWYRLRQEPADDLDLMDLAELEKERARLLLDRYGILFRELLLREPAPFKWRNVFRALRLMELSGEIVSGYFFKGIPGPQFMTRSKVHLLHRFLPQNKVFWINAQDPASMCGLPLPELKQTLPSRLPGNHLVYAGSRLVLTSIGYGRELIFKVDAGDADIPSYLGVFRHLLSRQFRPLKQITIRTINGEDASRSPYLDALRIAYDVMLDYKQLVLYPRMHDHPHTG